MENFNQDRYALVDGELVRRVLGAAEGEGDGTGTDGGAGAGAEGAAGEGEGAKPGEGGAGKGEGAGAKPGAKDGDGGTGAEANAKGGDVAAPETYTFAKVKNEKGEDVDVPEDVSKPIAEFAKAHKLTQEQAQAFLSRELELQAEAQKVYDEQGKRMQSEWRAQAMKDEVLSKDGKFDENVAVAKTALTKFFPDLAASADQHVFLDHPAVLRGLFLVGQELMEDGVVPAEGKAKNSFETRLNNMYPSMAK